VPLAKVASAHLAGVAVPGVQGLAQLLVQSGVVVTASASSLPGGSAVDRLRRLGVRIHAHAGHPYRPCSRSGHWLLCAPEINRLDPQRLAARRRRVLVQTPGEFLAGLLGQGIGLVLSGQRVASSAAAMIGWILAQSGRDPTFVLQTPANQLGGWARPGSGSHVVVHAALGSHVEEWARLAPRIAILLDDPADASGSESGAARAARVGLVESLPEGGLVLARPAITAATGRVWPNRAVEWLALEPGFDWWAADLRADRGRFRFRVFFRGRYMTELRLQVAGRRNVLGALAAIAACTRLDVPLVETQQALEDFTGVSGDFESRGSYRGVNLVDDRGENPMALGEAMVLARQVFGERRLWAVLEAPEELEDSEDCTRYAAALAPANIVLLAGKGGATAHALKGVLATAGIRVRSVADRHAAIGELDQHLEPGDVVLALGAGDEGTISDAFIRRLSRDRPG
jgi:UDP-N-acetylmuramate--alanine ligase